MAYDAVFVTGAPAAGKSVLLRALEKRVSPMRTVEFGRLIAARLKARGENFSHEELRRESANVIAASDIAELDVQVIEEIAESLRSQHVVIASHAVTHESYGVRVTAFSQHSLARLPLKAVVVLQAPPEVLLDRLVSGDKGRMWKTADQARRLQDLQTTVGLTYGVICGCPVYVFDSNAAPEELADTVLASLRRDRILI